MTTQEDRSAGIAIRRASPDDIGAAMELAKAAAGCALWSAAAYLPYCTKPEVHAAAQARVLFVAAAAAKTLSALRPQAPIVGFAAFSALPDGDCELENMAVAQEWRRLGIGRRLLAAGLDWSRALRHAAAGAEPGSGRARTHSKDEEILTHTETPAMWLEVRAGNAAAISFYRSTGFVVAGRRRRYYSQPEEDAVCMRMTL